MTIHRGTILLVDDEEKILKALGRALRDAGHAVVETTRPSWAPATTARRCAGSTNAAPEPTRAAGSPARRGTMRPARCFGTPDAAA